VRHPIGKTAIRPEDLPPIERAGNPSIPFPETPWDALGPTVRETVLLEDRSFVIHRPDQSDRLLDHPAVRSAFAADEFLPYWADLWPAARMLAKAVLREPWECGMRDAAPAERPCSLPLEALEIGCGLGLPGIAALARGLRVTFSDYDASALRFAAVNARVNGYRDFRLVQMDWRWPPADLQVPVLLASDLVYELRNVEPLVHLIRQVLQPGGLCLLTDQDRVPAPAMRQALVDNGLTFTTQMMRAGEPRKGRVKGTLYRITHAG
jgi:predicted nicotinamide N-methyase